MEKESIARLREALPALVGRVQRPRDRLEQIPVLQEHVLERSKTDIHLGCGVAKDRTHTLEIATNLRSCITGCGLQFAKQARDVSRGLAFVHLIESVAQNANPLSLTFGTHR